MNAGHEAALDLLVSSVASLDSTAMRAAAERQARLTKPAGSLGRLETLAERLAGIQASSRPDVERKLILIGAGDHGVTGEGVSAYPQAVTAQMVANFLRGGAAINVLARRCGAQVLVVDFGVAAALEPADGLVDCKLGPGTANFFREPAMTRETAIAGVLAGAEVVRRAMAPGTGILAVGEMGIGNTTPAAALAAVFCACPPAQVTGRGTGIDDAGLARKVAVIEGGLALHRPDAADPIATLATVGGFELAGLAGAILAAASLRIPVMLDGFITGAAALVAVAMCPAAGDYLIASHRSVEPGHAIVLDRLGLAPLFDLDLRLGEGSGAALALPLVDAAVATLNEMATFGEAGVSERSG
jgi:nicotinate-nucleotide--dimethylbenzimidazole phosphoribosyltransferase